MNSQPSYFKDLKCVAGKEIIDEDGFKKEADKFFNMNCHKIACEMYELLIKKYQKRKSLFSRKGCELKIKLGRSYAQNGQYQFAMAIFEQAQNFTEVFKGFQKAKITTELKLNIAQLLNRQERYLEAIDSIKAIEIEWDQEIENIEQDHSKQCEIIEAKIFKIDILIQKGESLVGMKRFQQTEDLIGEISKNLEEIPTSEDHKANILLLKGKIELSRHNWVSSREILSQYTKLFDDGSQDYDPFSHRKELGYVYEKLGLVDIYNNQLSQAKQAIERGYFIRNQLYIDQPEHVEVAKSLLMVVPYYIAIDQTSNAIKNCKEAERIIIEVCGSKNYELINVYRAWATIYESECRFSDAREKIKIAIEIQKGNTGSSHYSLANLYQMLGETSFEEGVENEAKKQFQKSCELISSWYGDKHIDLLLLRMLYLYSIDESSKKASEEQFLVFCNTLIKCLQYFPIETIDTFDYDLIENIMIKFPDFCLSTKYLKKILLEQIEAKFHDRIELLCKRINQIGDGIIKIIVSNDETQTNSLNCQMRCRITQKRNTTIII